MTFNGSDRNYDDTGIHARYRDLVRLYNRTENELRCANETITEMQAELIELRQDQQTHPAPRKKKGF